MPMAGLMGLAPWNSDWTLYKLSTPLSRNAPFSGELCDPITGGGSSSGPNPQAIEAPPKKMRVWGVTPLLPHLEGLTIPI